MDPVLTLGLWWGVLFTFAAVLAIFKQPVRWRWMILAVIVNAIYIVSIFEFGDYIPLEQSFGSSNWNWGGKIAAIGTTLVGFLILCSLARDINFRDAGFTLKQNSGSVPSSVIVIASMVALIVGLSLLSGENFGLPDKEHLAYQASMPGLDEEPFYRGYLLAILAAALPSRGINLGGAEIGWAGILMTMLFGMGHGLLINDGALTFLPVNIIITGVLGFALYWVRMRTGSLLLPIIGHNLINSAGAFFDR